MDDDTYDFIYASHVLEHTANPLRALTEWIRVVRSGGVIYLVVPNKYKTYDCTRKVTTLDYLIERYENDQWDFTFEEIKLMVTETTGSQHYDVSDASLDELCRDIQSHPDGTHHYTVYSPVSLMELSDYICAKNNLEMINLQVIRHEIHLVLQKNSK